jgi:hypothetical protein
MTCVEVEVALAADDQVDLALRVGAQPFTIWFRSSVPLFGARADALIPLGLLPAMHLRAPLVVSGTVAPRLLERVGKAQEILAAFSHGELTPTQVVARPAPVVATAATGVGAFFSGGVDSFYTALKHERDLTHLVFMSGFDIFDVGSRRGIASLESARAAAGDLGLDLVEIETNVHDLTDGFVSWGVAGGPVLATVALLLQSQLRRVLVPAGQAYRDLFPLSTHPLLDPLWGTEALEIVHDGCEATRVEKVTRIAQSDTVLRNLRVCNKQFARFNCGRCEKCVRTMLSLQFAGALERCATFPNRIGLRQVARVRPTGDPGRANWREPRARARAVKDWPMLLAMNWACRPRPFLALRRRVGREVSRPLDALSASGDR